jgi:cation/acetate symporter
VILSIVAVSAVTLGALGIGTWGVRVARTTSDLFVASRAVTPWWNAAAISGEYLSAASFLGIAGLMLKFGASALWLPIGFTAGYVALLLFVAAPLRRFGSYTIPDFAEARLRAPGIRLLAALIVALNVGLGGMRGITYVQAFQYWVKVFAISVPAILLIVHLGGLPAKSALFGAEYPKAPAGGLTVTLDDPHTLTFPRATDYSVDGREAHVPAGAERTVGPGELRLPAGAAVPVTEGIDAETGLEWRQPVAQSGRDSPLLVYSLLIATFLGTMGLPHILVRFYTNPDGSAARRTTVRVLGLLGAFYLFPVVYGLLGRALTPELYVTGETDSVVLVVPAAAWPGWPGDVLAAVVAAGAFAAFMSTASGLLVSVAGTVSYDVWGRLRRRAVPSGSERRRRFRIAAGFCMVVPALLALAARGLDISVLVGWAFALAASTFCPLFLLGIWWTRLTAAGAAAGMLAGAAVASGAIAAGQIAGTTAETVLGTLLTQPAVASVPIAFATMIGVSLWQRGRAPATGAMMAALHVPEGVAEPAVN